MILQLLTRLRQLCIDPYLFIDNYTGPSIKIETCLNLINQAIQSGHKVIIFSSFTKALEQLNTRLKQELINAYYIHGQVDAQTRLDYSNEFNNLHSTKVMLVSIKAGGTGLNLTAAQNVIHYDLWWNPAIENQATDRVHRIGQKNDVMVYRFITKGTLEESINDMLKNKSDLAEKSISTDETFITELSNEELREILRLRI
jgi:SNF2 family DNA or RNA helicase